MFDKVHSEAQKIPNISFLEYQFDQLFHQYDLAIKQKVRFSNFNPTSRVLFLIFNLLFIF